MNDERKKDLRERTKAFALRILKLCASLPKSKEAELIRWQLLKSGTSVGAHYREATRARSTAEFVSKMEGGLQELEESIYWLELLVDGKIMPISLLQGLMNEANEVVAIFVSSVKTAKKRK